MIITALFCLCKRALAVSPDQSIHAWPRETGVSNESRLAGTCFNPRAAADGRTTASHLMWLLITAPKSFLCTASERLRIVVVDNICTNLQ